MALTQAEKDLARGPRFADFINAIKEYRHRTGVDLRTAKENIEDWMVRNNFPKGRL